MSRRKATVREVRIKCFGSDLCCNHFVVHLDEPPPSYFFFGFQLLPVVTATDFFMKLKAKAKFAWVQAKGVCGLGTQFP
jgi:hypothetical protein